MTDMKIADHARMDTSYNTIKKGLVANRSKGFCRMTVIKLIFFLFHWRRNRYKLRSTGSREPCTITIVHHARMDTIQVINTIQIIYYAAVIKVEL